MIEIEQKKIAVIPTIPDNEIEEFDLKDLNKIIKPMNISKKREWFDANFYKCLPLSIGNMQGFSISVPYSFQIFWNGGKSSEDLLLRPLEDEKKYRNKWTVGVESHFGHGIFTVSLPFMLKTPDMVNLMTIAPPNYPTPGLSPMTGVVESDNLSYTFTINIKVDIPNTWIHIEKETPISCILPIPRYFCDQFSLEIYSDDMLDEKIKKERDIANEHKIIRDFLQKNKIDNGLDRSYFFGKNIRGNAFKDHQFPIPKKIK